MKDYTVEYAYKNNRNRTLFIKVRALDEKGALRITHNKIDNRIFEVKGL